MNSDKMNWTIGFGKYKGKTVKELLKDDSYCLWLRQQPWVKPWLLSILHKQIFCYMCQDNPEGMYAGDDCYIQCIECGRGH